MLPAFSSFSRLFWLFQVRYDSIKILEFFPISVKNTIGLLIEIALNMLITLGHMDILTILSLSIHERGCLSTYCVCFNFCHQCFVVFSVQVFYQYFLS